MSIISTGILISFAVSLLLGFKKRKFIFILVGAAIGVGVGLLSTYLYFVITPPREVGLGIIAFLPAAFVLFPFLNTLAGAVGGLIGVLIRKIKNRP